METEKNLKELFAQKANNGKTQIKTRAIMTMAKVLKGVLVSVIEVDHYSVTTVST